MKMNKHKALFYSFIILFSNILVVLHPVSADMPIVDVGISFKSLSELNEFYERNKFGVFKYSAGGWEFNVEIDKKKIYDRDIWYIIAPFDYLDDSGYPHKIPRDGCFISLSNIKENITVIITGFRRATVTINNFGGTVIFGKYVSLEKKIENGGWTWDWGILLPPYEAYEAIQNWINAMDHLAPAEYVGMIDSAVSVSDANRVIFTNFLVERDISEPILIENARTVDINGVFIQPSPYSRIDGSALSLKNVDIVMVHRYNVLSRYMYDLTLKNVREFILGGTIVFNGSYTDPTTGNSEVYGTGIYGNCVNETKEGSDAISAKIGKNYSGFLSAHAVGAYNESNQTFVGIIKNVSILVRGLSPNKVALMGITVQENIRVVARVNLTSNDTSQRIIYLNALKRDYHVKNQKFNEDIRVHAVYSNLKVQTNTTGIIKFFNGTNGTKYILHRDMKLNLTGTLLSGSYVIGTYSQRLIFRNLSAAIGVADDGSDEKELLRMVNNSILTNVGSRVKYHIGVVDEHEEFNVPYIFGGFSAIVGLFVTIGWIRIGIMMLSMDSSKRAQIKEMLNRAIIGTIITAMVIFGWANLLGVFNWVMGG